LRLTDYSIIRTNSSAAPLQACGFDADSYVNPDPVQHQIAHDTLTLFGVVIIVPREPLVPGKYNVAITANGQSYSWSFSIAPSAH
jgi:hypothetical protein